MIKVIFSVLVIAGLSFGGIETSAGETSTAVLEPQLKAGRFDPNGELISVSAKGLVCEFCAKALEKVFLRRDEVSGINVDLTTKEILINLKSGEFLDDETIEKLMKDSGYNIGDIQRSQKGNVHETGE